MTRKHVRSVYSRQRKWLRRFVSRMAYHDPDKAENANRLSPAEQRAAVLQRFKRVRVNRFEPQGAVLSDSRGEGSLQRVD